MDILEIIEQLKTLEPEKIILFGSQAGGEAGLESDIDIAIITETDKPFHERLIEARRLIRSTVPLDLFIFTNKEIEESQVHNPFIRDIVRRGKVVYGE
ncbi:MAG: nucleotidyltransferase domain-containing protein [Chloroflexi bacterium]|nr:nucleotidyltransferase domain-containing protein [Chloroflexota bacterium]